MLDVKQKFKGTSSEFSELDNGRYLSHDLLGTIGYQDTTFNITEDMHLDEYGSDIKARKILANRPSLKLLHQPLPTDLPMVQEDILIVMAAYSGDVDRYARLRRPEFVECELACCVHGIYHNPLFARWWMDQPESKPNGIKKAINARLIMNKVLSIAPYSRSDTAYLIWWPSKARGSAYSRLTELQPDMLPQVIRACIYAGYKLLFDKLLSRVTPDAALFREAKEQGNAHSHQALQDRLVSLDVDGEVKPLIYIGRKICRVS